MSNNIKTGDIVSWIGKDTLNDDEGRRYGRVKEIHNIPNQDYKKLRVRSGELYSVRNDRHDLEKEQTKYIMEAYSKENLENE